jgi:hypothetical protein
MSFPDLLENKASATKVVKNQKSWEENLDFFAAIS